MLIRVQLFLYIGGQRAGVYSDKEEAPGDGAPVLKTVTL
jgi:hypothetical protein